MDTTKTITHVSLCAGYGGIDLGLHRAIPNLRTIAVSEIEAFACANLVAKMEAGLLDPAPIWTDLKTFPWSCFRDCVDILSGGYPCQPFSAAGKRLGAEDPRHLWPHISAGIAAMRPAVCFFENVEGHISLGLPDVIEDLAGLGYRTTWGIFSASEIGAPHQRKRVFIMAHRKEQGLEGHRRPQPCELWNDIGKGGVDNTDILATGRVAGVLADAKGKEQDERIQRQWPRNTFGYAGQNTWPSRPGESQHWWEPPRVVADPKGRRQPCDKTSSREERWGSAESGVSDREAGSMENTNELRLEEHRLQHTGIFVGPSGATEKEGRSVEHSTNRSNGQQQAEQQGRHPIGGSGEKGAVGNTQGQRDADREEGTRRTFADEPEQQRQAQPTMGGNPNGRAGWMDYAELRISTDNRTDELRLLGNGVVPATAERAFRVLFSELTAHNTQQPHT